MGASGTQSASATIGAVTQNFSATLVASSLSLFLGNAQNALVGYPPNIKPAVRLVSSGNVPLVNVPVTFAVASGGGSLTTTVVNTNANGVAAVPRWNVGPVAGANTLTATVAGAAGSPVTITATGINGTYNIVIQQYGPAFSATIQAAFDSAKAAWEKILIGDQSDVPINTANACGAGQTINTTVDDIIILATFEPIDGPGQILGSAGACSIRVSNGLAIYGLMRFDIADTTLLSQGGNLNRVILHEMGHVLGFSKDTWNTQVGVTLQHTCAQNLSSVGNLLDTYFNCPITLAMFDSIGGTTYTGGNKVPLENCVGIVQPCGAGNFNSHWRELVFGLELMTPYFSSGQQNPFSVLSITTFEDIGYLVNYGAAEVYTKVFTTSAVNPVPGSRVDLSNDRLVIPVEVIDDRTGRVLRVIKP